MISQSLYHSGVKSLSVVVISGAFMGWGGGGGGGGGGGVILDRVNHALYQIIVGNSISLQIPLQCPLLHFPLVS